MADETYTIDENNMQGVANAYANTSDFHKQSFAIDQKIKDVQTAWIGRVDSCTSSEEDSGAGYVYATPMVAQTDAQGNALEMVSVPQLKHSRVQAGVAALVIDPAEGDLGVFVSCKNDSTNIEQGTSEPVVPGSVRTHDMSDSVMVGTVCTQVPTVYITLRQDNTISVKAPAGYTLETDADIVQTAGGSVTMTAGGSVTINASSITLNGPVTVTDNLNVQGTASISGNVTGDGVSLNSHTHGGVTGGSDHTGVPD